MKKHFSWLGESWNSTGMGLKLLGHDFCKYFLTSRINFPSIGCERDKTSSKTYNYMGFTNHIKHNLIYFVFLSVLYYKGITFFTSRIRQNFSTSLVDFQRSLIVTQYFKINRSNVKHLWLISLEKPPVSEEDIAGTLEDEWQQMFSTSEKQTSQHWDISSLYSIDDK